MNARLQLKLLRGGGMPAPVQPEAKKPPPLQLLGEGHDAIVQCTRRPLRGWEKLFYARGFNDSALPSVPTATDRLLRYHTAAQLHPLHVDPRKAELRDVLGGLYLASWRRGKFPRFNRIARLMPVPLDERCRMSAPGFV